MFIHLFSLTHSLQVSPVPLKKHYSRWIARIPHTKRLSKMADDACLLAYLTDRRGIVLNFILCIYLYIYEGVRCGKNGKCCCLKQPCPEGYNGKGRSCAGIGMSWRWLSTRKTTHSQLTRGDDQKFSSSVSCAKETFMVKKGFRKHIWSSSSSSSSSNSNSRKDIYIFWNMMGGFEWIDG